MNSSYHFVILPVPSTPTNVKVLDACVVRRYAAPLSWKSKQEGSTEFPAEGWHQVVLPSRTLYLFLNQFTYLAWGGSYRLYTLLIIVMLIISISAPTLYKYGIVSNVKYVRCYTKISSRNSKLMGYIFSTLWFNKTRVSHIINKAFIAL